MERLNLNLTFDEVRALPKETFKETVKKHVRETSLAGLKTIQETHSKSKKLQYKEIKMQEYLSASNEMTNKEKAFAFSARSQMLDVKNNFKAGKSDLNCSLGCDMIEDQKHILHCPALKVVNEDDQINYEDIFSDDKLKVKGVTKILRRKFAEFVNLKATVHGQSPKTRSSAAQSEDLFNDVNSDSNDDIVNVSDYD